MVPVPGVEIDLAMLELLSRGYVVVVVLLLMLVLTCPMYACARLLGNSRYELDSQRCFDGSRCTLTALQQVVRQ